VGGLVSVAGGIGFKEALIFGAMISATDPVAVVALFRSLGVPKRLQVILEGESLFNDGTAIVVFNIVAAYAVSGHFNLGSGILEFLLVSGGGILVGAACGIIVSQLIGRIDNYLVETTLTTILAYGSYLIADMLFGVSGVLAVVAAGLAYGRLGSRGMSPTTRIVVFNFWEYAAFLANSFVFLIIGLQIAPRMLMDNAAAIGWAILAVLTARAVTVYGLAWIGKGMTFQWKNVLFWSGLRGAISLALALSLAENIPGRQQVQSMAFGVVLFTLLVEGLTMKPLLKWSGISGLSESERVFNRAQAKAVAMRAAFNRLKQMNANGLISDYTWRSIRPSLEKQIGELTESLRSILEDEPRLHRAELVEAWRESLRTQRSTLTRMFRDNNVNEETYIDLAAEVDALLAEDAPDWKALEEPASGLESVQDSAEK
jgi:CPA1 family monovalent cation:H+ antiporter